MSETIENSNSVTMHAVATAVGVSRVTVSRVINNDCRVAPETVLAVREAVERLDYRPKSVQTRQGPRLRRRKPVRHQQVALLFGGKPMLLHTPVYSRLIHGIEERLRDDGWNLVIRTLPAERPWEAMPHRIDGVILFSVPTVNPRFMRQLRRTNVVQIMWRPQEDVFFDHVTYDEDRIGVVAAEYLMGRGHNRLACFSGEGHRRLASFVRTAREAGVDLVEVCPPRDLLDESGKVQVTNRRALAQIIAELRQANPQPTAIYVPADIIAAGLHNALLSVRLKPGVDIEIVGTNNDAAILDHLDPRPASVDIHAEQVGRRAVEQLYWRLDHSREPAQIIKVKPEIALK